MAAFEYIKNWTTEDDYVERGGICEELTVEITLREYRCLIEEKAKQAADIERLTADRDKFEKIAQEYGKALMAKHPDMIAAINKAARKMLGVDPDSEEETAAADVSPLTEDELSEMVKQNGGKPVVVFMYGIDEDGTLALDYGEWGMFDGRYFVCAGVEDNLRGYGDRFVAYKEPLPEKDAAAENEEG